MGCAWPRPDFDSMRAEGSAFRDLQRYENILVARKARKIALLITMEGVEPFDTDRELLRSFYELGVRAIGLTHARRNAAGAGGLFAPSGSSREGLTAFGRDVVQQCEALGVIVDLAHISPAGFEDILAITTSRRSFLIQRQKYYDIERNISDEQIKMIGERRGVIGVNAVLGAQGKRKHARSLHRSHRAYKKLDRYRWCRHRFRLFEFIYRQWPESARQELAANLQLRISFPI